MKRLSVLLLVPLLLGVSASVVNPAEEEMKMAVTAAFVSEKGMDIYKDMLAYISKQTGQPIKIVSGLTYKKVNELLRLGKIETAFICGYPYVRDRERAKFELLVAPVMKAPQYKGKPIYYSYVIVHKDSPVKKFEDLKDKSYAFSDPLSNSGHLAPQYKLAQLGVKAEAFFSKFGFSGAHEKSIEMVAKKIVDAASIDSLVWDYDNAYHPEFTSQTKIIEKHGPFSIVPLVVPVNLDPEKKKLIREAFVNMHKDPEGKKILDQALMERFVVIDDAFYNDQREREKTVNKFLKTDDFVKLYAPKEEVEWRWAK